MKGKDDEFKKLLPPNSLQISVAGGEDTINYWNSSDRKVWTAVLFMGTSMVFAARTILPLVAVHIAKEFDWNKEQTGLVMGSFFWGYPILQIIGGTLSDRIGGDYIILRSTIAWSSITFLTPLVPYIYKGKDATIYSMAFFRFLMGLSQGVHYPSTSSLISHRVPPENRATTVGIVFAASSCGTLLTGSVGSLLLEYVSWHSVFYVFGLLGLVWAAVLRHYSRKQKKLFTVQELSRNRKRNPDSVLPFTSVIWRLMGHIAFWAMIYSHLCNNFVFFMILSWFPTYFTETFPDAKGWIFNVVPSLLAFPASVSSGWFADKLIARKHSVGFSRKCAHTVSCICLSVSLFLISMFSTFNICLALAGLALFGQSFSNGGVPVNPNDIAPKHAGMVFGIMNTAGAINSFIGTYVAGVILHRTGSWRMVFNVGGGVTLTSWLIFLIFGQGHAIV